MPIRRMIPVLLLLALSLLIVACVPETDLERVAGTSSNDRDLTPIPDEDLPEIDELELRILSLDTYRTGGRVAVEIAIAGARGDDIRLADTARVEWSDGEITNALPRPGANIIVEATRSDPDDALTPVRVYLSNVTRHVGVDENAEVTNDEIITQWGTFPVLGIEEARRPPGWKLEYQAAGQRWVSEARLIDDEGRVRVGESEDFTVDNDFRPLFAVLRFGTAIEDLEAALPMSAHVEVRQAIPEMTVDL